MWFLSYGITKLVIVGHGEMGGFPCNACEPHSFQHVNHVGGEGCETEATVTVGVSHHSTGVSCELEWIGDNVEAEMGESIFEDAAHGLILCSEFRDGEKRDEGEGTTGGLGTNVSVDVCETQEDQMSCMVTGHH